MKRPPRPVIIVGIAAVLIALSLGGWFWWRDREDTRDTIQASGRIEVTEVNVGSKVTGRLTALRVEEGTDVKTGQLIADLEGLDLEAQLGQARATLQSTEAKLNQARTSLRIEPTLVRTQIRQAEETLRAAEERVRLLQAGSRVQEIEPTRSRQQP